ncbi:MAG: hypothetical protein WCV69_01960 [Patescibacteria group bacterium]|jgi:hypothetical protein
MKLEFFREDLRPEYRETPTSQVSFKHLNQQAQEALRIVKHGTFFNENRDSYNVIYVPR